MLVKVFTSLNEFEDFDIPKNSIQEILGHLKFLKGQEYTDRIIHSPYKYIFCEKELLNPIGLGPEEVASLVFPKEATIILIPDISGETGFEIAAVTAFLTTYIGATAAAIASTIIGFTLASAAMYGLSMAIQALMPSPEFSDDPSQTQNMTKQSRLFNGAPLIREQGGSVPLMYGNPFCGGVLISSGKSTEDF